MDFVRIASNPWGQEVLLGLAWDVLWVVAAIGALFVVVHAVLHKKEDAGGAADGAATAALPERIERHGGSARISHWLLAVVTFVLLITAFVPILGLQFPWVTIHWIAGLAFGVYVVYHTIDTVKRGTLGTMWLTVKEMTDAVGRLGDFLKKAGGPERKGKWNFENKAFHHITALAGIAVLLTGLLMMLRIDTTFWAANPYIMGLSDGLWGLVYFLHGLAAVGFVGLLIAHIYFAIRPEKLWFTRSMIKGWITREEYLEHFDSAEWDVTEEKAGVAAVSTAGRPGSAE